MRARCLACGLPIDGISSGEYHVSCARSFFGMNDIPVFPYSADEINQLARELVLSRSTVPGVQAKLSVHLDRSGSANRLTIVGFKGGYILKLPTETYPEITESEHFGMTLGALCGLKTAPCALLRLQSGGLAYLTRRLDRMDGVKHMLDMCQLTNRDTDRKYSGSHEQVTKVIKAVSASSGLDLLEYFGQVVYSYLLGNSDMHLKNYSMLREHNGDWHLAAGYDLLPVKTLMPDDRDDLALTLNGKKSRLNRLDFERFAASANIVGTRFSRQLAAFCELFRQKLPEALERSFLSDEFKAKLLVQIRQRLDSIFPAPMELLGRAEV